MINKKLFHEQRAKLDSVLTAASQEFNTLSVKQKAELAPIMSKTNEIDDASAAAQIEFDSLLVQIEGAKSETLIKAATKKAEALLAEINYLIEQAEEAHAKILDVATGFSESEVQDESQASTDESDAEHQENDEATETKKRTRNWLFFAFIAAFIAWLSWRNHDFSEATMFNGQPILIEHKDAESEWAALLAGFAAFAGIFFINEAIYSVKKRWSSDKDSKHRKSS